MYKSNLILLWTFTLRDNHNTCLSGDRRHILRYHDRIFSFFLSFILKFRFVFNFKMTSSLIHTHTPSQQRKNCMCSCKLLIDNLISHHEIRCKIHLTFPIHYRFSHKGQLMHSLMWSPEEQIVFLFLLNFYIPLDINSIRGKTSKN